MQEITLTVKVLVTGKPDALERQDIAQLFGRAVNDHVFWETALAGSDLDDEIQINSTSVTLTQ